MANLHVNLQDLNCYGNTHTLGRVYDGILEGLN